MSSIMTHAPALVIAFPLLAAFLVPVVSRLNKKILGIFVAVVLGFTLLITLLMAVRILPGNPLIYVFGGSEAGLTLPSGYTVPIRIIFHIDSMGIFMGLITAIVSFLGAIYSIAFMDKHSGLEKYYALLLLLATGMFGMEFTGDIFNFFVFLEIASIASVALIAFRSNLSGEPAEAGFKYMVVSSISALMVLFAVGLFYGQYDVLNMATIASVMKFTQLDKIALILLVTVLAMKAGSVPMHMWTPDAYSEAPASITMILVAASQASLYALFRIIFSLYNITLNTITIGWIIIILGLLSMFIGVTMAIIQKDIKRLMAYHAVSQTGYMLLGVGVGIAVLANPIALETFGIKAMEGGIFHIMNHAMYKGLLFLTAGALFYRTGTRNLNKMGGLGNNMIYTAIFFIIGAAAIAGIPPFNGFASKLIIYESVFQFNPLLSIIAMLVSILTLASFVKVFHSAFLGPKMEQYKDVKEVPKSMLFAMGALACIIVLFGLFPDLVVKYIVHPAVMALINQSSYTAVILGGM
ncbi:MAG: proton-conducting transporter membrane subunit [Atribacterota bacterium]|jgi:multicomponent Na+:H+ antiporter subunit D|nr:proton-conducting transporter membrane subunit [Atribacterota bacterium]MDD3031310.1 proton-conducting transporter membrane subunit [Atribacterota bacterium]MDD3640400.1 proton-conducting transporter membrane subunit [Atribacterota bacterium]MDD4288192.1 proton-conducting transporter membrane subunit [Atribacterota bacterium]MDD4764431.1 proton-conducting transporter membrane subunit [Atribacterota bacterium]